MSKQKKPLCCTKVQYRGFSLCCKLLPIVLYYLRWWLSFIYSIYTKKASARKKRTDNIPYFRKVKRMKFMSVIYVFLLAVLQGVTEFIPVSSYGHLSVLEQLLGMERNTGLLLESMLHVGTLAAIVFAFRKDLKRLGEELLGMTMDLIGNLNLYIHNKRTGDELNYAKIVHGTYRRFTSLLLISLIPTFLLGFTGRNLADLAGSSAILPGIGFLLTGIFLLVTDLNNSGGEKGPRDVGYSCAMWMGICQGLAIFPGVSRMGLTICAALLCGCSRKFAVRFSILMSFPAVLGAFFSQIGRFASGDMTIGYGILFVIGAVLAGVTGCLVIRSMQNLVQKKKLRYFAYYSFLAGIAALAVHYL